MSGFAPPRASLSTSNAPTSNDLAFASSPTAMANVGSSTALASGLDFVDVIVPAVLFGGAVFATVKYSEKEDSARAYVITKNLSDSTEEETKEEIKEAADEKDSVEKDGERKYEFTTPAAKREKEAAAAASADSPSSSLTPKPAAPAPVPAPAPAPKPVEKDISQIRNEVASTLDSRKEMQKRLDDAKAERSKKQPPAIFEEPEEEGEKEEVAVEHTEEADDSTISTNGKKRQFVGKLVKKVVMPWKKWSNL